MSYRGGGYQQGGGGGGRGRGGYEGGGGRGGRGGGGGRGYTGPPLGNVTPEMWSAAAKPLQQLQSEFQNKLSITSATSPPESSKALKPPRRPWCGTLGVKCVVRANHFLVQLSQRDLHHYDVSINPDVASKFVCRDIFTRLVQAFGQTHLGKLMPAYDGKKSIYTAGPLPFLSKEFEVEIPSERPGASASETRKFIVTIKFAAKVDLHHLQEFLGGRISDTPQDVIQALDVVLRSAKRPKDYVMIGRSFFSTSLGTGELAEGLHFWRGYYQSIRPTQMGLSLNIDASARPFFQPIAVTEFVAKHLNLRELGRPLSDADRVKVKKVLRGVTIETNHRGFKKRSKVTGVSSEPANQLMFSMGELGTEMSVAHYFQQKYQMPVKFPLLPCIQIGSSKRPTYLPMEVCTIVEGQKYVKKLNERQVSDLLKATCQRPHEREGNVLKMIKDNKYPESAMVKREFGMGISEMCTTIDARVLPPPVLQYHDSGRAPRVAPSVGQWNMIDKKMFKGAEVRYWACLNFSRMDLRMAEQFCIELTAMCVSKGMVFNKTPCVPIRPYSPAKIERALKDLHSQVGKDLQLLIIILPDSSGSYGMIKRICETELGIVSQCCQPRQVMKLNNQYLENVALKINVKAGGSNSVLWDAFHRKIPRLSDHTTIIFGADVTHAAPGEDSSASIAAVVASMDWPCVTKYKGLVSAQGHREEIIQDLFKVVRDQKGGERATGMIRELLIAFYKANNQQKPKRIIFYRDGVSEGQFAQVLGLEVDAIRKACLSLEENYLPLVTFVVVQKRHHTRLFPTDRNMTDKSGNILPGTVVDTKICHPSQFDFYLCSHAGIQGTSRPTHYHVLHDENNFTPDLLQLLTNSLCYTYARCTRSVSVVPPAYYAHLVAFRARYYVEGMAVSESGSTSGREMDLTQRNQAVIHPLPQIMDKVKDVMFFC